MKNRSVTLIIGIDFEHQFADGGPKITAMGQVIVCPSKDEGKWIIDCVEIVDIHSIQFMGVSITGYKEQKSTVDHFKSMGIDLYDEAQKILEEIVDCSGNVKSFVYEQTGIALS